MYETPFWESGLNPITMKKEESWSLVPTEDTYDFRKKRKILDIYERFD